jgi:hypothetical protein
MNTGDWVRVHKPKGSINNTVGKIINIEKEDGVQLYRVHLYQKKLICWFDDSEISPIGVKK